MEGAPTGRLLELTGAPATMRQANRSNPTDPHPLEGAVLAAFKDHPSYDRITLAPRLGGTSNAFVTVAQEVLAYMTRQGKLWRDDEDMYRLRTGGLTIAEECHARRNCRSGLRGLVATVGDGSRGEEILASRWEVGGVLMLKFEGRDYISADRCRLVSKWKVTCCRPSARLLEAAIARRGG